MYTEVLHDLTAVLKEIAAKRETDETTITSSPSITESCKKEDKSRNI
jgi:hypothetical protein